MASDLEQKTLEAAPKALLAGALPGAAFSAINHILVGGYDGPGVEIADDDPTDLAGFELFEQSGDESAVELIDDEGGSYLQINKPGFVIARVWTVWDIPAAPLALFVQPGASGPGGDANYYAAAFAGPYFQQPAIPMHWKAGPNDTIGYVRVTQKSGAPLHIRTAYIHLMHFPTEP